MLDSEIICFFCVSFTYDEILATVLDCKPLLSDMEDLVLELNKSNGLFRFVRIMRGKFQAAASGMLLLMIMCLSKSVYGDL